MSHRSREGRSGCLRRKGRTGRGAPERRVPTRSQRRDAATAARCFGPPYVVRTGWKMIPALHTGCGNYGKYLTTPSSWVAAWESHRPQQYRPQNFPRTLPGKVPKSSLCTSSRNKISPESDCHSRHKALPRSALSRRTAVQHWSHVPSCARHPVMQDASTPATRQRAWSTVGDRLPNEGSTPTDSGQECLGIPEVL